LARFNRLAVTPPSRAAPTWTDLARFAPPVCLFACSNPAYDLAFKSVPAAVARRPDLDGPGPLRPACLLVRHSGRRSLDSVEVTTKDTKGTKMEFDELPNRMIGCAIAVHWHLGQERKDRIERFFL
jgi:hypothetical protein